MARIVNRGNGKWLVVIYGGYGPDGSQKRIHRTLTIDSSKTVKAQELIAKREAAALETDYQRHLITEAKKTRLSEVAEEYLEHKQIAARTKAGYRMLLDTRILPSLGKAYVQDLSARQIREFYKKLENAKTTNNRSKNGKLSGTYRRHYHQLLSAILNFAVKSGYITISPMIAVDPPRMDTPEAAFLDMEDIAKVMDVLECIKDPMWKAFFILEMYTSCRPGELIGLDWSDLKDGILTIKAGSNYIKGQGTVRTDRPKTKASNREIVLPESVLKILEKWKARQAADKLKAGDAWPDHNALFTNTIGNRLYLNNVTGKWRKIQKAYDLKDAPLYSLRHTGASLLIESGCSIEEVSRRLGHSRASTTLDIYTHLFEKASQHTTDVMTDAIAKARKKKKAK